MEQEVAAGQDAAARGTVQEQPAAAL